MCICFFTAFPLTTYHSFSPLLSFSCIKSSSTDWIYWVSWATATSFPYILFFQYLSVSYHRDRFTDAENLKLHSGLIAVTWYHWELPTFTGEASVLEIMIMMIITQKIILWNYSFGCHKSWRVERFYTVLLGCTIRIFFLRSFTLSSSIYRPSPSLTCAGRTSPMPCRQCISPGWWAGAQVAGWRFARVLWYLVVESLPPTAKSWGLETWAADTVIIITIIIFLHQYLYILHVENTVYFLFYVYNKKMQYHSLTETSDVSFFVHELQKMSKQNVRFAGVHWPGAW